MKKISVGMLLFPGFQLLDIAGPRDAFAEVKNLSEGECQYEIMTIGSTRSSISSSSGMTVVPDRTIFDPCPDFYTVIVPECPPSNAGARATCRRTGGQAEAFGGAAVVIY